MGIRNYLIEGVSGTGKTTVCDELQRRGHHAIHGDRELAYQGNPVSGEPTDTAAHESHIWDVDAVTAMVADQSHPLTFFCGGSRNFARLIEFFDGVFVLDVDAETLQRRLDVRPDDEPGGKPEEQELIFELHRTKEDIPRTGVVIDATAPVARVADEILRRIEAPGQRSSAQR